MIDKTKLADAYERWLDWVNGNSDELIKSIEDDLKDCFNFTYLGHSFKLENPNSALYALLNGNFMNAFLNTSYVYRIKNLDTDMEWVVSQLGPLLSIEEAKKLLSENGS